MTATVSAIDDNIPFQEVETQEELDGLMDLLLEHRWLRGLQIISSLQVSESGTQRGYVARLIFQADSLTSHPIELHLGNVMQLNVEGAMEASAEGSAHRTDYGFSFELNGASFACERVSHRRMPPADPNRVVGPTVN